jgi:hypothetical protein
MNAWFSQHRAALLSAIRRLAAAPMSTLLSLLVIGIALTLPAFGYVLLDNLRDFGSRASGVKQISVFMELAASRQEVAEIEHRLQRTAGIGWRFVPREDALKRLQQTEGMAEIVASLPRNPLPDAFIVEPENTEPAALDALGKELAGWPQVAHVQLDSAWVKRFDAFLRLGKLALMLLAGLFAAGLVAVTFNTIRLQVVARAASKYVWGKGCVAYCPHAETAFFDGVTEDKNFLTGHLEMLDDMDAVYVISEVSSGMQREIARALELDIPVFYDKEVLDSFISQGRYSTRTRPLCRPPVDSGRPMVEALTFALNARVAKHGNGAFVNPQEGLGVVAEEYHELIDAIRSNEIEHIRQEAMDVVVAALWLYGSLSDVK